MIEWNDKYKAGVEHIDLQHKTLFQYINDFEGAIDDGDLGKDLLILSLTFFENYAKMHFGDEENCMYRYQCPVAGSNKNAHRKFIEFFDQCKMDLETNGYDEATFRKILEFTEQWLKDHICKIDTQLKSCVHQ